MDWYTEIAEFLPLVKLLSTSCWTLTPKFAPASNFGRLNRTQDIKTERSSTKSTTSNLTLVSTALTCGWMAYVLVASSFVGGEGWYGVVCNFSWRSESRIIFSGQRSKTMRVACGSRCFFKLTISSAGSWARESVRALLRGVKGITPHHSSSNYTRFEDYCWI